MTDGTKKRGIGNSDKRGKASLVERVVAEDPEGTGIKVRGIGRPRSDGSNSGATAEKKPMRKGLLEKAAGDQSFATGGGQTGAGFAKSHPNSSQNVAGKLASQSDNPSPDAPNFGNPPVGPQTTQPLAPRPATPGGSGTSAAGAEPAGENSGAPTKAAKKVNRDFNVDAVDVDLETLKASGYITPDMPTNLLSEEFRIIKRTLVLNAFAKGEKALKNGNMILVSSSNPSEGKTFCAVNLALSIATEQDLTVLLVDADFSKPDALNRLGVNAGKGLMDILDDDMLTVADCLVHTNIPKLVLLPAGRPHNLGTEMLASDRMREVTDEIANRYKDRIIIFDSPPALASSAASVLALHAGQAVFVIEAERTTETMVKDSLNLLSACPHINLLLNKTRYSGSNTKFATYYGYGAR